jgi:hypothetical protein
MGWNSYEIIKIAYLQHLFCLNGVSFYPCLLLVHLPFSSICPSLSYCLSYLTHSIHLSLGRPWPSLIWHCHSLHPSTFIFITVLVTHVTITSWRLTLMPLSGVGTTCFSSCCDKDSETIFTTDRLPDVNLPWNWSILFKLPTNNSLTCLPKHGGAQNNKFWSLIRWLTTTNVA